MGFGQFLLGGTLGGGVGMMVIKAHALQHMGIAFHLRAIAAGNRVFEECDYRGSALVALVDAKAWNRLILDMHSKLVDVWPRS
eukprot:CAMPEP_0183427150 /NCGR_PEP_ID=MMETSP0370-20130417/40311_1 /TAXON_ID=268820 /ORGANISM="Peridinium aciculiferum, Strain PAER-2" /LENGTH=82 /DNA_ID=CAMNT_0025611673 /DNA_START=102 /DNA_END=350 /DNA_ORIENTATION=-